jgi:hypothetical protein
VKLFGPGQPGRIVMDAAPGWVVARFCGTRLVVLESRPHQVRMTVRDRPLGKPRVLVARRTKRAQAPAVECDAHDVVYDTREGRPERTVLHAVSLRQPGEPAQPGP